MFRQDGRVTVRVGRVRVRAGKCSGSPKWHAGGGRGHEPLFYPPEVGLSLEKGKHSYLGCRVVGTLENSPAIGTINVHFPQYKIHHQRSTPGGRLEPPSYYLPLGTAAYYYYYGLQHIYHPLEVSLGRARCSFHKRTPQQDDFDEFSGLFHSWNPQAAGPRTSR